MDDVCEHVGIRPVSRQRHCRFQELKGTGKPLRPVIMGRQNPVSAAGAGQADEAGLSPSVRKEHIDAPSVKGYIRRFSSY